MKRIFRFLDNHHSPTKIGSDTKSNYPTATNHHCPRSGVGRPAEADSE